MRIAIDTNRLTDFFAGDRRMIKEVEAAEEVWIPFVVIGEIQSGFLGGNKTQQNEVLLAEMLSLPNVAILYAERQTTHHYARLFVQLKRAGTPIPDNDIWIAALALQHDLTLVTRDHHFQKIPQLLLV